MCMTTQNLNMSVHDAIKWSSLDSFDQSLPLWECQNNRRTEGQTQRTMSQRLDNQGANIVDNSEETAGNATCWLDLMRGLSVTLVSCVISCDYCKTRYMINGVNRAT